MNDVSTAVNNLENSKGIYKIRHVNYKHMNSLMASFTNQTYNCCLKIFFDYLPLEMWAVYIYHQVKL